LGFSENEEEKKGKESYAYDRQGNNKAEISSSEDKNRY
jgi:hypothetical protein